MLTCDSSWHPGRKAATGLKFCVPNSEGPGLPAPLGLLVDHAIEILGRHWRLLAAVTLITLIAQAAVYYFVRGPLGANIAAYGLTPFVTVVANVRCALDLRDGDLPVRELLTLALGRLWAVILIDSVFYFAFNSGAILMCFPGNDAVGVILGFMTVLLTSTLALADVYASVEPEGNVLLRVPLAFMRSISLSWQNGNMLRVLALAVFLVTEFLLTVMLEQWFMLHPIRGSLFLADVPLSTAFAAPFAVLFTVVYFDCLAREKGATS